MKQLLLLLPVLFITACTQTTAQVTPAATPSSTATPIATSTTLSTPTDTPQPSSTPTPVPEPTATPADTSTPTLPPPTETPLPEPTPLPTDTPAPQLPTATPTLGSASSKKGLGVIASPGCQDMDTLRASWYLNWWPNPDPTCPDDVRFVPRIANPTGMQYLPQAIGYAQASSGWLIGFSEPNLHTQGDMTPQLGAELWRQIEDAVAGTGVKLVSPSPNQFNPGQDDPYGHQWLWAMVDEYNKLYGTPPHFDAIGWNIYGCTNNPNCKNVDDIKNYLVTRYQEGQVRGYNVPVWVLEYGGCQTENSAESDQILMRGLTGWFDDMPWIARYAWFSNRVAESYQGEHNCTLIGDDGGVTELGKIYFQY